MTNNSYIRVGNQTHTPFSSEYTTGIALLLCIGVFALGSCFCVITARLKSKIHTNS